MVHLEKEGKIGRYITMLFTQKTDNSNTFFNIYKSFVIQYLPVISKCMPSHFLNKLKMFNILYRKRVRIIT